MLLFFIRNLGKLQEICICFVNVYEGKMIMCELGYFGNFCLFEM